MARLYTNENFPMPVAEELRRLGHDVLTLQETGKAGLSVPDNDVLSVAIAEDRVIVTLNRKHFVRLHHAQPNHAGIIVCTFDPDFVDQAHRIHVAIESQTQLSGQLIRVNRPAR
jgi:predicted nuclease of predicted toxin-antitoxin system